MTAGDGRTVRYPLGAATRLSDLAIDPYPVLAELRAREPVTWVPESAMWFVTRRDDVLAVLHDPETFTTDSPDSTIRDIFGAHMMTTEGPDQLRYKKKCLPPFHARRLEAESRPAVGNEIARLVSAIAADGAAELTTTVARPIALFSVMSILGLPAKDTDRVNAWYEHFAQALANFKRDPDVRAAGKNAASEFGQALEGMLGALSDDSAGTLLGDLVCDRVDPLTRAEIQANALIILFGGIETTESMIANAVWALLSHPRQWDLVVSGEARLDEAIEETLRWEPAVQSATRHATRRVSLRGAVIEQGEAVQCMLGAANRDPGHFDDPDRFDIRRDRAGDHLSFAVGRHFCLGAPLARIETRLVIEELIRRLPRLRLDPERPGAPVGYEFRKPEKLHVLWDVPRA